MSPAVMAGGFSSPPNLLAVIIDATTFTWTHRSLARTAKDKALAAQGKPQRLLTGKGGNLGLWVIDKIDATASGFTADAGIQRHEFTLSLRKHSDGTNV